MTDAADAGLERMYRLVNGRNHLPDGAAQLDDASRAQGVEAFVRALRLDDRIKVAAVGDVERQRSEAGNLDLDAAPGEVGRHVPDADGPDPVALRLIVNVPAAWGLGCTAFPDREADRGPAPGAAHRCH